MTSTFKTMTLSSLGQSPPPFTLQGAGLEVVVIYGADEGRRAPLPETGLVIGGEPGCGLLLSDPAVSRRHLEARRNQNAIVLKDLGSKNGSFVEERRIDTVEVACGAEFRVGDSLCKIVPCEEVVDPAPAASPSYGGLTGGAPTMRKLFSLIEKIAPSQVAVLLEGETGVGKEVVAEEIHRRSPRRDHPFVIFDCGAVPDELIESTLFGHVKGAFTGATSDKVGVLCEADGGTVFLDEIGELGLELQPALLRVLDRGMVRPVGATAYRSIDVRVVSATHRNLSARIQAGEFREDLYYRLAVVRMRVPPLRERAGDVALLVHHFLARMGRPDVQVTEQALELLTRHPWPGNVRELKNIVERALALSLDGHLSREAILSSGGLSVATLASPARGEPALSQGARLPRRPFREAKAEAIEQFEETYLRDLMGDHSTVTAAADAAEMDRKHLRTLLRRYGLVDGDGK